MNIEVYFSGDVHVATVNAPDQLDRDAALEFAWVCTQNIEGSWSKPGNPDYNPAVTVRLPLRVHGGHIYGHRSSMVGDRFVTPGGTFEVASMGFTQVAA
jgi:hypothetical protein